MTPSDAVAEPDYDTPLSVTITAAAIMDAVFATADQVHTGWESCVDPALVVADMTVADEAAGNYCRLVEQSYTEDDASDVTWHDWAVELRLGETFVTAHWRAQAGESPGTVRVGTVAVVRPDKVIVTDGPADRIDELVDAACALLR